MYNMKAVKIYTMDGCGACVTAKKFMDNKGISYESFAVDRDREARLELISKGVTTLPVIIIGDTKIDGFNPQAIMTAMQ